MCDQQTEFRVGDKVTVWFFEDMASYILGTYMGEVRLDSVLDEEEIAALPEEVRTEFTPYIVLEDGGDAYGFECVFDLSDESQARVVH